MFLPKQNSELFRFGILYKNLDINTHHLLNLYLSLFLNLTVLVMLATTNIEIWNIFTLKETVDLWNEWKSFELMFWRLFFFLRTLQEEEERIPIFSVKLGNIDKDFFFREIAQCNFFFYFQNCTQISWNHVFEILSFWSHFCS